MPSSPVARLTIPERTGTGLAAAAALIMVSLLLVYGPALRGGFLWDDDAHVTKAGLRSVHGLWRIWTEVGATQQYYPVLHSAFWLEHRLWGDSVLGYHLVTLLFHALAACLLVVALARLELAGAWLIGLVFAVHPVGVESVAWISEQKNTLSAVFYLASALAFLRFDAGRRRGMYALALGLFCAALLTKSVTATLPAALLLVFWWRRRHLDWKRDVVPLLPWFAIAAVSGLFTAWTEVHYIGASGTAFDLSAVQRVLLAAHAICFYLGKVLFPAGLIFIYPRWTIDPGSVYPWGYLAAVIALFGLLLLPGRRTRGALTGLLFFAGTLFPVLGFVNVYPFLFSFVADHFQYLASIGVIVPVVCALQHLVSRTGFSRAAQVAVLLLVPLGLGVISHRLSRSYRDSDTLNRSVLAQNPGAWLAHYNLAVSLGNEPGRLDEAMAHYRETIRLKPDHWSAHSNLASALLRTPGGDREAVAEYRQALALNPDFAEAANDLGIALGRDSNRLPAAIASVRQALALRPDFDGAHNTLGNLLRRMPDGRSEAIVHYREAIRLAPDNAEYHYNLANALVTAPGTFTEGVAEYRTAIRIRPDYMEAHHNLGAVLARSSPAEAETEYRSALKLSPNSAQLHSDLANALAKSPGRLAEADGEFKEAIRLDPADPITHLNYGVLLSTQPAALYRARAEFAQAVRLDPKSAEAHYGLAVISLRLGESRAEAEQQLREALAIRPDFAPAASLLKRLSQASP